MPTNSDKFNRELLANRQTGYYEQYDDGKGREFHEQPQRATFAPENARMIDHKLPAASELSSKFAYDDEYQSYLQCAGFYAQIKEFL